MKQIIQGVKIVDGVLEVKMVDKQIPCKECGKNPRAQASSRCAECSGHYKSYMIQRKRLLSRSSSKQKN